MMNRFIWEIILLCILIICLGRWFWTSRRQKHKGQNRPTMFDVRQLIIQGKKEDALKLYAQIYKVSCSEAKKNVDELEKHIQEKHRI